jgi:hypothetical protein
MAIKEIYLLPQTLLEDMDIWLKNPQINVRDVMGMIGKRFTGGEIKFSERELYIYMKERRAYLFAPDIDSPESKVTFSLLPMRTETDLKEGQDQSLDNAELVDVRDRARLMRMLKEKVLARMKLAEDAQKIGNKDYIEPYLESLVMNYTKVLADLIEKEVKLQLEVEESSKLEKMIDERLNMVLFLIWKLVEKYLTKEHFVKFKNDEERYDKFKEEIKEIFKNYGIDVYGKFEQ